jgi:hypothetical protein
MLEVDNVYAGYGRIPVLSGINFSVAEAVYLPSLYLANAGRAADLPVVVVRRCPLGAAPGRSEPQRTCVPVQSSIPVADQSASGFTF